MKLPIRVRSTLLLAAAISPPCDGYARPSDIAPQMQCLVDRGIIPGAVTLAWRDGHLIHQSAVGYRDIDQRVPMTRDTIFRLYSMTKPVTSVAIMMLVEQGRLTLDTGIDSLIPAFRDMRVYESGDVEHLVTVPVDRPITVRDLLTHSSGLTYHFTGTTPVHQYYRLHGVKRDTPVGTLPTDGPPARSLAELVERLGRAPLLRQPGQEFDYSYSTTALGHVIERVSGMPLDRFLETRIFRPLGMTHTSFFVQGPALRDFATLYLLDKGGLRMIEDSSATDYSNPARLLDGGGALASTAGDYLRFARMLANGGSLEGVRLLNPETVADMLRDHLPASAGGKGMRPTERFEFGYGFQIGNETTVAGETLPAGAAGWDGSGHTFFWVDPRRKEAVVGMTQVLSPTGLPIGIKQVSFRALQGKDDSTPPLCQPGN
ncbi:MAG: hypothetical protein RLZZ200_2553 [Pseudomonadota bacterium]